MDHESEGFEGAADGEPHALCFAALVSYDGAAFHGWQQQPGLRTVQGTLEAAVGLLAGQEVRITGAGRTDRGVHAEGQVASFRLEWNRTMGRLTSARRIGPDSADEVARVIMGRLDRLLPEDLAIRSLRPVPEDFDARHSAIERRYRYRIRHRRSPLERHREWYVPYRLDPEPIEEMFRRLRGHRDFRAFTRADLCLPSYDVELRRLALVPASGGFDIEVWARRFLHNMIRILAGTAVEIGRGKLGLRAVEAALRARDRRLLGPTAPPRGLCLERVLYPSFSWSLSP